VKIGSSYFPEILKPRSGLFEDGKIKKIKNEKMG
jgi:hypothetical protein